MIESAYTKWLVKLSKVSTDSELSEFVSWANTNGAAWFTGEQFNLSRDAIRNKRKEIQMRSVNDQDILDAMKRYGGSFVQALAVAWQRADMTNQAKLRSVFGNYWDEYRKMAELNAQKQSTQML